MYIKKGIKKFSFNLGENLVLNQHIILFFITPMDMVIIYLTGEEKINEPEKYIFYFMLFLPRKSHNVINL